MNFKQILFTVAVLAFASSCFVAAESPPYYYYDYYYDYYYYPYYYYSYETPAGSHATTYLSLHGHNPTAMMTADARTFGKHNAAASTHISGLAYNPYKKASAAADIRGFASNLFGFPVAHAHITDAAAINDANVLIKNTAESYVNKFGHKFWPKHEEAPPPAP